MSVALESPFRIEEECQKRLFTIDLELAETAKRETSCEHLFRAWLSGILAATRACSGIVLETTTTPSRILVATGADTFHAVSDVIAARRDEARRAAIEKRQFIWFREEPEMSSVEDGASDQVTLLAPLPRTEQFAGVLELSMSSAGSAELKRAYVTFIVQSSRHIGAVTKHRLASVLSCKFA